ncbi:MAG: hypothetical protein GDA43_03020 [Hormoscilla sp. SP5CHS1]|nr:hypothetical protein [Hormoscilla sp. SP5CHS1]
MADFIFGTAFPWLFTAIYNSAVSRTFYYSIFSWLVQAPPIAEFFGLS